MKTRCKIWTLFFGILVAAMCIFTTLKEPQEYSGFGRWTNKIEESGLLVFNSNSN
jgi:hypothetical protein